MNWPYETCAQAYCMLWEPLSYRGLRGSIPAYLVAHGLGGQSEGFVLWEMVACR